MSCDSCHGGCGCLRQPLPNDRRYAARYKTDLGALFKCPVMACHMGPDANVYVATLTGPDGRQRTVHGCVKHIGLEVSAALSGIRLEPFTEHAAEHVASAARQPTG